MKVLVTGGAGFIGSAVVRLLVGELETEVVNVDALTHAGNLQSLAPVAGSALYRFVRADIRDRQLLSDLFRAEQPDAVIHLAAESQVDHSVERPAFIETNILGTYTLLEAARDYWNGLSPAHRESFRFHHVSTDEVYGSRGPKELLTESTAYAPKSPYSASKAGSDHLVRAWYQTYGLPVLITNSSSNYGPYHLPEKLIPTAILNGLEGKPMQVYGTGAHVRDWLFVEDHARALWAVLTRGTPGEVYNVGGEAERSNLDVVRSICGLLDEFALADGAHDDLITFVADYPDPGARNRSDISKIARTLGWRPRETFETGLRKTVRWYLDNRAWWEADRVGGYAGRQLGRSRPTEAQHGQRNFGESHRILEWQDPWRDFDGR